MTTTAKTAPKTKQARRVPFDTVKEQYAEKRGGNVTDKSKSLRGQIRAHRAELADVWPGLADHEKGNRYPDMPAKLANAIVTKGVAGALKS